MQIGILQDLWPLKDNSLKNPCGKFLRCIVCLARVLDRYGHRDAVVLRWTWLFHGHVVLLVNVLGDLNSFVVSAVPTNPSRTAHKS